MKKYMFFDIDGTLTSGVIGLKPFISSETKDTLRALEKRGHVLSIATGRPYFMTKAIAEEVGIHNIVCNGGNDVYMQKRCLQSAPLDRTMSLSLIHQCIDRGIAFAISISDDLIRYSHNDAFLKLIEGHHFLGELRVDKHLDYTQIVDFKRIYIDKSRISQLNLQGMFVGSSYKENYVIVEPDDKYRGIEYMMHVLHAPKEDIVVFGDGNNDIRMFQSAPCSIAMGNGIDELKKIASFVTHRSDEDGIRFACHHYGWL